MPSTDFGVTLFQKVDCSDDFVLNYYISFHWAWVSVKGGEIISLFIHFPVNNSYFCWSKWFTDEINIRIITFNKLNIIISHEILFFYKINKKKTLQSWMLYINWKDLSISVGMSENSQNLFFLLQRKFHSPPLSKAT